MVGRDVRGEKRREADERREEGSSPTSMGLRSSPPLRERSELWVSGQSSGHAQGAQASELWTPRSGSVEGSEGWVVDQGEGT